MNVAQGRMFVPWAAHSGAVVRRRLSRELIGRGIDRTVVDDALLVVGELVANAVQHAPPLRGKQLEVLWRLEPGRCWIGITGATSSAVPFMRPAAADSTAGRGMRIVNGVADEWGVRNVRGRATVWAALPIEPDRRGAAKAWSVAR